MQHIRTLLLTGFPLVLTACAASTVVSPRLGPPPSLRVKCAASMKLPERALTQAEVETFWGRIGLRCEGAEAGIGRWSAG